MTDKLRLFRLVAVAAPNDPHWHGDYRPQEVTVCAMSPADARIIAAERELDFLDIDAAPAEDKTTVNASIYRDEKLFEVRDVGPAPASHQRGIIQGEIRMDTIKPSQVS